MVAKSAMIVAYAGQFMEDRFVSQRDSRILLRMGFSRMWQSMSKERSLRGTIEYCATG